jgi:hypothetical protein
VIPENCRHCTSPLRYPFSMQVVRLGLPPAWTRRCLPQCWYMYTSLYNVTPEDCEISLTTVLLPSPQTSVKSAGSYHSRGPGSIVSIATGYRLDGPGIESRWGQDFPYLSRLALGLTQPPVQCVPGLSRR